MSIMCRLSTATLANVLIWAAVQVGAACESTSRSWADDLPVSTSLGLSLCQEKLKPTANQSAATQAESYVNLTLRLGEGGKTEIVRATQVDGKLIERQGSVSEYVYEISKDGRSYYVGFLPQGGLELRGFRDLQRSTGEKKGNTTSTTVILNVPDTSLDALRRGRIGLRIYKIKEGVQLEAISADILRQLVIAKTALLRAEISGSAMAKEIKPSPN